MELMELKIYYGEWDRKDQLHLTKFSQWRQG